jgi:16S rRNA (cytosine967-C5)-methyltransferase
MWKKMYGEELTVKTLESINCKPPVFAIPNTLFVNAQELLYELNCCGINGEVVDDVVMLNTGFDVSKCKAFKYGLFYIEDMSSYNCAKALGVKENDVVLDVCSAPGGKTFTIAIGMNNTGNVYAYDLHKHRCDLVEKSAQRLDIKNISVSENDATIFNENIPLADKILCDVPCSGFGIIRRKPEIRYKNLDSIKELPAIQYQILETSSKYLKTGGRIIYSTCTLNKRENENVVNAFLQNNNNFTLLEQKTTFPSQFGGDGFFWALMEKKND